MTSRSERIVLLDHEARSGGAQLALFRMVDGLIRLGLNPKVILLSDGEMHERYKAIGCDVLVLDQGEAARASRHDGDLALLRGLLELLAAVPLVRQTLGDSSSLLHMNTCLLYTSPSPRDQRGSRMPSSA